MDRLISIAALASCLVFAGCASTPPGADASTERKKAAVKAVARYYAREDVPAGWRLERISGHNGNVFVTVALSDEQWKSALSRSIPATQVFYAQICPRGNDSAWIAIAPGKDILIEVAFPNSSASIQVSCRRYGTT